MNHDGDWASPIGGNLLTQLLELIVDNCWLVVWNFFFIFPFIYIYIYIGNNHQSSQLTFIFFRGVAQPPSRSSWADFVQDSPHLDQFVVRAALDLVRPLTEKRLDLFLERVSIAHR